MINLLLNKLVILSVLVLFFTPSFATSVSDLVRQEQIVATNYLNIKEPIPIASQVTLIIDISIPESAKFSQGTKINHFEVDNAVVLPQGPFALNSVKRINGKKYINQLWEIPIFPQKSGDYVIPSIVIEVGVEHEGETIVGKLVTSPLNFTSFTPSPYISDENHWLVAQNAKLTENITVTRVKEIGDESTEQNELLINVGDSIEREITLTAQSSLSMLFPVLIDKNDYQTSGSTAYLAQGEFLDKEVRGTRNSSHTEKITLVVQDAGSLVLPEIEVVWWDTKTNSEKRLSLPSQEWTVKHTFSSFVRAYSIQLSVLLVGLGALGYGLYRLIKEINRRKATDTMPLWYQFSKAMREKNWGKSESVVYRKVKRDHNQLTLVDSQAVSPWDENAQQLQKDRYRPTYAESKFKTNLLAVWKKLR